MQTVRTARTAQERAALLRACPASMRATAAPILSAGYLAQELAIGEGVHTLRLEAQQGSVFIQQDGHHRAQVITSPPRRLHSIGL